MKKIWSMLLAFAILISLLPPIPVAADNGYLINGVYIRWDDYSPSAPKECWTYANQFYKTLWGVNFTNQFSDTSNSLRNLSDAELTLTEEHLKSYVTHAALGSCLRICNADYLHGTDGMGHSQIIVQKDDNGFTVFEGGLSDYPYCREQYFTWSEYIAKSYLGGKYAYIKYIKWPDAPAYVGCSHEYDTLGVCACGHIFDWESTLSFDSVGIYGITQSFTPRLSPYDSGEAAEFQLTADSRAEVLGTVENAHGQVWYTLSCSGTVCYAPEALLYYVGRTPLKVQCGDFSPSNEAVLEKKSQPVLGTVSSNYPLSSICAYLDGKLYATWTAGDQRTTQINLRGTDVNHALTFATLSEGRHTLELIAHSPAQDAGIRFHSSVFYITAKAGEDPVPGQPVLQVSSDTRLTAFTWDTTLNTTHYDFRLYRAADGEQYELIAHMPYAESGATFELSPGSYLARLISYNSAAMDEEITDWLHTWAEDVSFCVHSWMDATCTSPKACALCGATQGDSIGHHYSVTVTAPTCSTPGYTTHTCSGCADTFQTDPTARLGHSYADNTCTRCGYTPFPDVPIHAWYADAVEFAVQAGYFSGYQSGSFGPADSITRQDFVVVLARMEGIDLSAYSGRTVFQDVQPGSYYEAAVNWASSTGVVMGYNSGNFGVGDSLTREQLVTILYRYARRKGCDMQLADASLAKLSTFADSSEISSYAKTALAWALQNGVISGLNSTTLGATRTANRAQTAQILTNIAQKQIIPI